MLKSILELRFFSLVRLFHLNYSNVLLDLNLCPHCVFCCSYLFYACTSLLRKHSLLDMPLTEYGKKQFQSANVGQLWKHTTGDRKEYVQNLHPGISVSSLSGGTVSNVFAYFLAACRCACRASISFLVLGIRHLNIQHRVITNRERTGHSELI